MNHKNLKSRIAFVMLIAVCCLTKWATAQTTTVINIGDTTNMFLTSTNNSMPYINGFNSYTQQLVQKDELNGAAMITGIDLYCGSTSSIGRPGCTIYLANTYVPDMGDGMVGFGPLFQQVAVDPLVCSLGWNHYDFDTTFYYNGLGNLIIAVDCPWGNGGNFYVAQRGFIESRYANTRLASLSPFTSTTGTTIRNIMRLHTQPLPSAAATCPAPTMWVDSSGSTAMKMRWSPGYQDTSWTMECITDGDTGWHSSGLLWGDTSYTMAGLTPNSHYTFRLTAFCTDTFTTVLKHAMTNCTPMALPYTESLESLWYIPDCWYLAPGSAGNNPAITSSYHHTGSNSVQLRGGTVVLPPFDTSPDSLELYFWATKNTSSASLYVGMVTDPLDLSTFYPLDTVALASTSGWVPVSLRTNRYPRTSGRIAIKSSDPANVWLYIDDIEVSHIVPCEALSPATLDWTTDTAALIRWTDTVGAVYYDVAYGPSGFVPDSSTTITNIRTDSLLLTALLPYTQYDVYVRPECGSYTAHWSPVSSFRTLCSLIDTLPYMVDFDSFAVGTRPPDIPCWQGRVALNTNTVDLSVNAHSGTRVMRCEWSIYESVVDQKVTLPAINTATLPMGRLQLSFWAKNIENTYNRYDPARIVVGVMDNPAVDSTFQTIDTVNIVGDDWRRYDVPLTSYSGTGKYLAILSAPSIGSRNNWLAYFDDVTIDLAPPCADVTGIGVTGLTSTSVTVAWDAADSGTRWQAFVDSSATATPIADTTSLSLPTCTFGGLTTGQPYYVWLRAICPKGDTSGWEGPLEVVPGLWNMRANRSDTLTLCGVNLYDNGGSTGVFSNQHSSLAILPDMPGHLVSISGSCDVGSSSSLTIYDGVGTTGPVLWAKTVNNPYAVNFGPITSDAGAVTLYFDGLTAFNYYNNGFDLQVSCLPDTCIIHHLRLDPSVPATTSALALTWQCNGASHYEVEYGPVGFLPGSGTLDSTTTNHFTISGLSSLDRREVRVRSICGAGDTGAWVHAIFATQPCSDAVYRENYDSTLGESNTPSMPIGFNGTPYSYVQTIVDSAHLAGLEGGITALAFHPIDNMVGDHQSGISVYLANVADTAFASGPIMPDAGHRFVKVVDSANFCHDATTEWQLFAFDRPFMWDGHQNLLVAVLRQDGGSGARTEYAGHYRYSDLFAGINRGYIITDSNPIDIDSADHYTSPYSSYGTCLVGDLRLYTNTCDLPLCAAPVVDSITSDYESITIQWSGTGNEYQISITPGTGSHVTVSGDSYTFTALQPATTYQISLRQNCTSDSLGYSDWVTVSHTTDTFLCPAPDTLYPLDVTHVAATFDWSPAGNDNLWQLEVWQDGFRHQSIPVTGRPFTVEGLNPGTRYNARLHGYCGSADQISGAWSATVTFATTACPPVRSLDTIGVTTTSVALVWEADTLAQDYLLQYGPAGFGPAEGADSIVSGNGCVVYGLRPATAYDFYLRTRCGDEWLAEAYTGLLHVVTRQTVGIPTAAQHLHFTLTPNPAQGVATVTIEGLPAYMTGMLHVTVADLTGRDLLSRDIQCDGHCRLSLNIESLPSGAYFVRVESENASSVRKLIVK